MRYTQGEIFLGDLVRAFDEIGVGDQEKVRIIAHLLGFGSGPVRAATGQGLTSTAPVDTSPASPPRDDDSRQEMARESSSQAGSQQESGYQLSSERTSESDLPVVITSLSGFDWDRIPAGEPSRLKGPAQWPEWGKSSGVKFPHQPLLFPGWTRGILSELVASWREAGKLDLRRTIETIATGKSLDRLPRVSVRTLARGCQVLLDVSSGMAPFAKDCRDLIESLQKIVGHERVEVLQFEGSPIRGVEKGPDLEFSPYKPPPYGTPVLLISDLGIANPPFSRRRAITRDWLNLIEWLDEVGCPMVALVPYPRARWPRALSQALSIIQWDNSTSATDVRRARQRR